MTNDQIIQHSHALAPSLGRIQYLALVVGLLGIVGAVGGYSSHPDQFFQSYLLSYVYWMGLTMGSLGVLMMHHLAGGRWGFSIRRLLEAGTRTLPVMIILFIPVIVGLHTLYEWTHLDVVKADPILSKKQGYLNESSFLWRQVFYFALWGVMAFLLNRWSSQQDTTVETHPTRRMQRLSGIGILVYALSMTLAAVDWIMSLEPHWFSTIFSAIYILGQMLLTWAFVVIVGAPLSQSAPLNALLTNERLRDLGTFMLAFVMLWTYTSFSQLLITWGANLPEEISWYLTRLKGSWLTVGYLIIGFHFLLPFVLLVSSRIKARIPILVTIALGLMLMRLVDLYWITAPAFDKSGIDIHWLDVALPVGMGGIWVSVFFWHLKRRSLVALNDPRFDYPSGDGDDRTHG